MLRALASTVLAGNAAAGTSGGIHLIRIVVIVVAIVVVIRVVRRRSRRRAGKES